MTASLSSPGAPTNPRTNDTVNPVGAPGLPYFGWHLTAPPDAVNQIQTRFQIQVASWQALLDTGISDVWDSGAVASRAQNHIPYRGAPLHSNTKYYWRVRVWDREGKASPFSETATFVVGLLTNDDWAGARWIRRPAKRDSESTESDDYAYYRKTFALSQKPIARATVFVTAVHKYELYLNGALVGKGPAYHYPQYQYYNAYDITARLMPNARNLFALFHHWFGAGQGRPAGAPGVLLQASIQYGDGTQHLIGTDASWKQKRADGWLVGQPSRNHEGVGYVERIDAAQWIPGWNALAYDDSHWDAAVEIGAHPTPPWTGNLYPDFSRIVEYEISPVSINDKGNGTYVVDLGKVYAGRPRLEFSGGQPGTLITLRGGYSLAADGTINPDTNQQTDMSYHARANGGEFTFLPQEYLGMRHVQVENAPMPITPENFTFVVRHAALDASRSAFTSSHPTLNAVWELLKHSVTVGAQEQFLDTPTREKGGFLVDSMNESLAAMSAFGERVLTRRVLGEFLQSMEQYWSGTGDRGRMNAVYPNGDGARDIPDFTQAYLVWVWEYYMQTGDCAFLEQNYGKFEQIGDYVHRHTDPATGLVHNLSGGGSGPYQYGIIDWPPSMRYGYDMTTEARTVINCYAYADYTILADIAAALGRSADCERYRLRADRLKHAINQQLLAPDGLYTDGLKGIRSNDVSRSLAFQPPDYPTTRPTDYLTTHPHTSQHANMFPLALNIVPPDQRARVLAHVKQCKMSVGMVTVYWLVRALGESEAGEHLLELYTNPSWDGWAKNLAQGATCTWESWDADRGGELSQSHPWGAVGLCGIQQYILGVEPLAPQYERAQIKPLDFGDKLMHASGRVPTERGAIWVEWQRDARRYTLTVELPVNVEARVCLPCPNPSTAQVTLDGAQIKTPIKGHHAIVPNVGSGRHSLQVHAASSYPS